MGLEIERRFIVDGRDDTPWRSGNSISIFQCYLSGVSHSEGAIVWKGHSLTNEERVLGNISTWRIRLQEEEVILTAKGFRVGATATEYEWQISKELFDSLPLEGLPSITKTRHLWLGEDDLLWEVDEFEGELAGLIIAEVELEREDQDVIIPSWTGLELTTLRGWSNAALSRMIMDVKLL
jgi:adenylate cyclase